MCENLMYHISAEKELQEGETFPPLKTDFTEHNEFRSTSDKIDGAYDKISGDSLALDTTVRGVRALRLIQGFLVLTKSPISARCHFPHRHKGRSHTGRERGAPINFGAVAICPPQFPLFVHIFHRCATVSLSAKQKLMKHRERQRQGGRWPVTLYTY